MISEDTGISPLEEKSNGNISDNKLVVEQNVGIKHIKKTRSNYKKWKTEMLDEILIQIKHKPYLTKQELDEASSLTELGESKEETIEKLEQWFQNARRGRKVKKYEDYLPKDFKQSDEYKVNPERLPFLIAELEKKDPHRLDDMFRRLWSEKELRKAGQQVPSNSVQAIKSEKVKSALNEHTPDKLEQNKYTREFGKDRESDNQLMKTVQRVDETPVTYWSKYMVALQSDTSRGMKPESTSESVKEETSVTPAVNEEQPPQAGSSEGISSPPYLMNFYRERCISSD